VSYDLAVWSEPRPSSQAEAEHIYGEICAGNLSIVGPDKRVSEFREHMLAEFPEAHWTNFEGPEPFSVWAGPLEGTETYLILHISPSHKNVVLPRVAELADRFGLVRFDPQESRLCSESTDYDFVLLSEDGKELRNPDPTDIERELRRVGRDNWNVVLESRPGVLVQVGYGEDAGVRPGWYALEYREGSPERHYRAVVSDLSELIQAFQAHLSGEEGWKRKFSWRAIDT